MQGAGGKEAQAIARERGRLIRSEAERLTGMPNQRVSDLGKRIESPDKYRADLLGAEYRAGSGIKAPSMRG